MKLAELFAGPAPVEISGDADVEVSDLTYDSRQVGRGALYFCVRGERADGHDFAPEAVERGATALVVDHPLDLAVSQVTVADGTPVAAEKLARVLTNDPGTGVLRHVDAGYDEAIAVAGERGVRIPMHEA